MLLLFVCFLHSSEAYGRILKIPVHYPTIQEAIEAALPGDTLVIGEGRYYENIDYLGKAITLGSLFILDGDSGHIGRTIIDGSRAADSKRASTVRMLSENDSPSVLKGLTITGGGGTLFGVGGMEHFGGGGIMCQGSALIEDNIIEYNHLSYANKVNTGAGLVAGAGKGGKLIIRNNLLRFNTIRTTQEVDGGGMTIGADSGAFVLMEKNRVLHNSIITRGTMQAHGGGISFITLSLGRSVCIMRDNTVSHNEAHAIPGNSYLKAWGGGISIICYEQATKSQIRQASIYLERNQIHNNLSSEKGGGIGILRTSLLHRGLPVCPQIVIRDNILSANRALDGAGLANVRASILMMDNSLQNDLSEGNGSEIFLEDVSYAYKNDGIINAQGNEVQGGWPDVTGLYQDFPKIHSFEHTWKLKDPGSNELFMSLVPKPWFSWWAICLYVLLLIFLLWLYRKYLFYRFNLKAALQLETAEKERIHKLDMARSRFFANISHEFRTPLTLISGPLETIMNDGSISKKHKPSLQLMQRNLVRLQNLVRQLLEMARLEAGTSRLQVSRGSLSGLIKGIAASYHSLAETRQLAYHYKIADDPTELYFDRDKVEKILNNLLSNAFKFTSEGERIDLTLEYPDQRSPDGKCKVQIVVADTGPGMEQEHLEQIFDRFFRVESTRTSDREGTGIGLSLVRELVELYRGHIRVESEPGKGSRFILELPAGKEQFEKAEIVEALHQETAPFQPEHKQYRPDDLGEPDGEKQQNKEDLPLVLLVDDNDELRSFIVGQLETDMRIIEAPNGRVALEKALEFQPDLIISDLMMPEMDGAELVERLRNDEHCCHIPLIMLTARADMESKRDCFEKGSDAFLEKPFSVEELRSRSHQLIERRKLLREHYLRSYLQRPDPLSPTKRREDFLERLLLHIRKNLSSPELNVEELSRQMGLSRVQLYRKVSSLTGISPVELIRNTRLEAAARHLKEGNENVTQVMYEVGINSPSHFTASFRKLFGLNPSDYHKMYHIQKGKKPIR